MRQLGEPDYLAIKAATRLLIKWNGGLDAAAAITRVERSQLSAYQNIGQLDSFIPSDVVADLESACGKKPVTEVLAKVRQGEDAAEAPALAPNDLGGMAIELTGQAADFARAVVNDPDQPPQGRQLDSLVGQIQALSVKVAQAETTLLHMQVERPSLRAVGEG